MRRPLDPGNDGEHDDAPIPRTLHAATADTRGGHRACRRRHALGKAASVQRHRRRDAGDRPSGERVRGVHGRTFLSRLHVGGLCAANRAARLRPLSRRARADQRLHAVAGTGGHRGGGGQGGAGGDHRGPRHRPRRPRAQGGVRRGAGADALAHARTHRRHGCPHEGRRLARHRGHRGLRAHDGGAVGGDEERRPRGRGPASARRPTSTSTPARVDSSPPTTRS